MPVAVDLSPEEQERYRRSHRWSAAIKAGLLAGVILLMFPGGNPWTSFSLPNGALIMGRPVSTDQAVTFLSPEAMAASAAHLAVSMVYALLLMLVVYHLRSWRALLAGAVGGLVLYGLNFAAFKMLAPQFTGNAAAEFNVALAHVLFGGIAAGAVRGFLRPPQQLDTSKPNPGPRYP